ncbi:MAG: fibronectin type III domain-containing protein [Flavobacteriales bacterium]|nr:fibronectin type III domain-containing protein [Flavobacteriales bacterium]
MLGSSGANNSSVCYLLTVSAFVTQCNAPQGLASSAITYNTAQINWISVQGATSYDLRWKPSASPSWTDVLGIVTNTYSLAGLSQLTTYDVQVRTNCGGAGSQGTASNYTGTHSFTTMEAPCDVIQRSVLAAKVFLDGAYRSAAGLMVDSLRKLNLLPMSEPYTAMGFTISGSTSFSPGLLGTTGNNAIVDWVLVELRQNVSPYQVVEARAGLLQRDGDIVATDGVSPLGFCANAGTYRVAVRHRNHLGVMTGNGIALSGTSTALNLTLAATPTYGTAARKTIGAAEALWAGNVDGNGELKYTGQGNDRDPILAAVGGSVPTSTVMLYHVADVNLDGTVKYTGEGNDRDFILTNVGGSVPTNTRLQQLP